MRKTTLSIPILLAVVIVIVAGCANYALVDEAKKDYERVKNDPAVMMHAPNLLKEAEKQFKIIGNLKKNGASKLLINHHAFIAEQKLVIAEEMATLNKRQDELAEVEKEYQLVLGQVQQAEAQLAKKQAVEARMEADEARRRTEMLSRQLADIEAEKTERGLVVNLRNVLFDSGKSDIKIGAVDNLAKLIRFLLEYRDRNVLIEGFTDNLGARSVNQRLSEQRASAVKQALINSGIKPDRIITRGYGEDYAIADNSSEAGRQQNRRVEVVISDETGTITSRRPVQ